ncbi:MAG: hypothetical protein PWQ54_57 [Bacteroidales bacterium]|jgi:hypothetical protein|nr:hypothetical protein [Bacteroidales bacterium]
MLSNFILIRLNYRDLQELQQETVRCDLMLIGQSVKHQKRLPGAGHDRLYQ